MKRGAICPTLTTQGAADKMAAELRGRLLHQVHNGSRCMVVITDEGGEIAQVVALWDGRTWASKLTQRLAGLPSTLDVRASPQPTRWATQFFASFKSMKIGW
jgi:hypothetical protein